MESQYSREIQIESQFISIINSKFKVFNEFLASYDDYKETSKVPYNITWEKMKESYGWGYKKGSIVDPLITWIYLRPDVKKGLERGDFKTADIPIKFIINKHYFIVEQKAISYFKLHCLGILQEGELVDEESSSSEEESKSLNSSDLSYQTLKRKRKLTPVGIDDFAVEVKQKKVKID